MNVPSEGVVFSSERLLPDEWRKAAGSDPVRTFNPAILADGTGWLFAYRVVAPDGLRRIAICRLDSSLAIVEGSAIALSDRFRLADPTRYPEVVYHWFADPRLYRFGSRLFIYWNSGWHEPQNHQFIQELDARTLHPIGEAREFLLAQGARQKLEKNWTLFAGTDNTLYAVYSVTPHRVLQFSLAGSGDLEFDDVAVTPWSIAGYPANHGGLRGGSPPVRVGDAFFSFCHSVHDGATGYRYAAAVYRFSATAPFAPTHAPAAPLPLHNPFGATRVHASLNPAVGEVLYPCGAAFTGQHWLVSHGINDEHCAISLLSPAAVDACAPGLPGI